MKKNQPLRKPDPRGYGITISAYVTPEAYKRLVNVAGADRRSVSNVVEGMIDASLPAWESKLGLKR